MSNLGFQWVYRLLNREEDIACDRFFAEDGRRPPRPAHARDGHAARRLPARRVLDLVGDGLRQLPAAPPGRAHPARARRTAARATRSSSSAATARASTPRRSRRGSTSSRWATARSSSRRSRTILRRDLDARRDARGPRGRSRASTCPAVHGARAEAAEEGKIVVQQFKAAEGAAPRAAAHDDPDAAHGALGQAPHRDRARLLGDVPLLLGRLRDGAAGARLGRARPRDRAAEPAASRRRVGLIATAVADHPEILPILRGLAGLGFHIALSSVKIDAISEEILAILTAQGERALAIAPEAGNERLRRAINKKVSDEMLLEKVRLIARSGITQLKLYLQVGLPGETDADVDDIVRLVDELRARVPRGGAPARARRDARPDGERVHPEAAHAVRERAPRRPRRARRRR